MAWGGAPSSAMFEEWVIMMVSNSATGYAGLDADACKVALYDNDITPDRTVAANLTGYNTGQWVSTGNEVIDSDGSSDWSAGGVSLSGQAISNPSAGVIRFDATDTSHSNTVTLINAHGCLVYDDAITAGTVADQGISYHYFGGAQSVTTGTFTIVWHANGLFQITV